MVIKERNEESICIELDESEFTLIQYLLEKSKNKVSGKIENSLAKRMFQVMKDVEL
jgi:hypothetical protein